MMREPRISDAAVDAERGVVLAELRESNGPQKRIADATTEHLFAGKLIGDRSPIGTIASLNAARASAVQAFHNRWYRPDRAVVVIVGDEIGRASCGERVSQSVSIAVAAVN